MTKFPIIFIFLFQLVTSSLSMTIYCHYTYHSWIHERSAYVCALDDEGLDIYSPNELVAGVTRVYGIHDEGKSNEDVIGFYSKKNEEIEYFPKGLEKFYQNILGITINEGRLKEVRQSDLKVFPKLINLDLLENDIQVLEAGLFDYNLELKLIFLQNNKISCIYPTNFDNLINLEYLYLSDNECINMNARKKALKIIIRKVDLMCQNELNPNCKPNDDSEKIPIREYYPDVCILYKP